HCRNRLSAALYELRLFPDEPILILRTQKTLLVENLRLMGLMLRPVLILALPVAALMLLLDAFYGLSPLPVGRPALRTVHVRDGLPAENVPATVHAPGGVAVETPVLRSVADNQLVWRLRPSAAVSGLVKIRVGDAAFEKEIDSRPGPRYVSSRRVADWSE